MEANYSIHYHVWTSAAFMGFLLVLKDELAAGMGLECEIEQLLQEPGRGHRDSEERIEDGHARAMTNAACPQAPARSVTVIVPVYGDWESLRQCLASLKDLSTRVIP